jgi:hypothetical protein
MSEESNETYHDPDALFRISSWANFLSWAILVVYLILFIAQVVIQFQNTRGFNLTTALTVVSLLSNLLIGAFFFVVLRAISEGIYIFLEIEEDTKRILEENSQIIQD